MASHAMFAEIAALAGVNADAWGTSAAFLDYDNDGWMNVYLVNSGKCDFNDPNPPLRNALYRDRKSTRLNSSHRSLSRMPSSA